MTSIVYSGLKHIHTSENSSDHVFEVDQVAMICKFSDTEFSILHSFVTYNEQTEGVFRGKTDESGFYSSIEEALAAVKSGNIGGPDGDLDLDETERRHYEVVGVYVYNPWVGEQGDPLPDPYPLVPKT